jgi:hypothetical protein
MESRVVRELKRLRFEVKSVDLVIRQVFEEDRNKFFKTLAAKLRFLQDAKIELNDHLAIYSHNKDVLEFGDVRDELQNKIKDLNDDLKKILNTDLLKKNDLESFRVKHETLLALKEHLNDILVINVNIEDIDRLINERVDSLQRDINAGDTENTLERVASSLINMKTLADNLPKYTKSINARIDDSLARLTIKHTDPLYLFKLSRALQKDPRGIGMVIIAEHEILKDYVNFLFNEETKRHDIEYVLKYLEGDNLDVDELRHLYEHFDENYKKLVKKYMLDIDSNSKRSSTSGAKGLNSLIKEIRGFASWSSENNEDTG